MRNKGRKSLLGVLTVLSLVSWLAAYQPERAAQPPPPAQRPLPEVAPPSPPDIVPQPGELQAGEPPAGEPAPKPSRKPLSDADIVSAAKLPTDGPGLLAYFKHRTLPERERADLQATIQLLGSAEYREREKASADLLGRGPAALELLRAAVQLPDRETARRAERLIQLLQDSDPPQDALAAALRLLAERKPAGAVQTVLDFLPFAEHELLLDECRQLLATVGCRDGKADPLLVQALADAQPQRRGIAAEAIAAGAFEAHQADLRKLLRDRESAVRFRTARALATARDRDAVPTLIDALPELPLELAWQADEFLLRLAGDKSAPSIAVGNDPKSRELCRTLWRAWWRQHGDSVDLAAVAQAPKMQGRTLVVLLDEGRVVELDNDNRVQWTVNNLLFPLDVQRLDDDRILVAEYHANRVTERSVSGGVIWQKQFNTPLVAQRLPNGNTFIANEAILAEFDKAGKQVLEVALPEESRVMKAVKLPNGEIACQLKNMNTQQVTIARLDASGKELKSFPITLGMALSGGRIHMLPSGRVLIAHNAEDKVVEYDASGKVLWEVSTEKPIAAVRLANGHTMITSMNPAQGATEVDRAGNEVWAFRTSTRVTRAIKR